MKKKKKLVDKIRDIVEDEAVKGYYDYDIDYEFRKYNSDTKMIFIFQRPESNVDIEFRMLTDLEKRLQKINPRFLVGIICRQENIIEDE